ncbi:hypothetical protein BIW11_04323 [Tropilaelaps mercedesae]|uniref:Uncharacterized protein n=1 Tax=Tropilaelaps mercedesae TaxID=418985 RepID=A0A1V9X8F4_9ACAR|nr:hypothetical protein BIW11_04323 [Tropilaelaps mercedesae]
MTHGSTCNYFKLKLLFTDTRKGQCLWENSRVVTPFAYYDFRLCAEYLQRQT